MFSKPTPGVCAFAAAVAASFWSFDPAVSGESPEQKAGTASYLPIQSISHDFGSKALSGYYVKHGRVCLVILMISEKGDLDHAPSTTAARVRMLLDPGEIAGVDSEEGVSANVTCGENANTLTVDIGDRDTLMDRQTRLLRETADE